MFEYDSFSGKVYEKNIPLLQFEVKNGKPIFIKYLNPNLRIFPIQFKLYKTKEEALMAFLEDRLVPETRQNIREILHEMGLLYYDPIGIIRYNHGLQVDDTFWIEFKGEHILYDSIKLR